jgi:large subunit ribosomal protein L18e
MKSKTLIGKQVVRKNNPEIVETILAAKKKKEWLGIARVLSGPRSSYINLNLHEINNKVKEGENVVVPGKILSQGEIDKKIKIIALGFSETAKEKLKKSGSKTELILNEIKSNPDAKGLKILT